MYDPKIARFLQEDTYSGNPNDPLSLNLYTYAHNDPLTYDDPSGHLPHIVITSLFGGLIGGAMDIASQMLIERKSFKELNWKSVGQSALEGAISGAIAGATGGASLAASAGKGTAKLTAKQVAKKAAKTAVVHGTTGAAINATAQYAVKGEINASEVFLSGAIDFVTGGVGSALPHTKVGKAIKTFSDNAETKAKNIINDALDNTRIILGNERGSVGGVIGKNIDDVVDAGAGEVGSTVPKMDKYGMLKKDTTTPGQAHHINQDAAYRDIIPTNEGMAVKLEGNAFTQPGTPHYETHSSMETFWNQFRRGGERFGERPTNLEYSNAMLKALKESGMSDSQAMQVIREGIKQRVDYGALGGELVPRIPGRINQVGR